MSSTTSPIPVDLGSTSQTYTGGDDDYVVIGGDGDNTVTLGDGDDQLTLGAGNNTLTLGGGTDSVTAGTGNNTVTTTGDGIDTINLTDGNNTVSIGDGANIVQIGDGADIVTAGNGDNTITLGNGVDQLTTGNGNSQISVGNGAGDALIIGNGANTIILGTGIADTVTLGAGSNTVSVTAEAIGADSIKGGMTTGDGSNNRLDLTTTGVADISGVSGFQSYQLANGGQDILALSDANFINLPGATITVVGGDTANTVDASALSAANSVIIYAGSGTNTLTGGAGNDTFYGGLGQSTVDGGAGTNTMVFAGAESDYEVSKNGNVTIVTGDGETDTLTNIQDLDFGGVPCFLGGTLISTPNGDRSVESLAIGDLITSANGAIAPVKWIGRRNLKASGESGYRFADPLIYMPIRIRAGALGDSLPARDLLVSADHGILVNDILVQAGALVNGVSVVRQTHLPETFTYYHIELDNHALILAEGVPAETFVDNVTRMSFDNWDEHQALFPDAESIAEMDYPRVQSQRQVPPHIRQLLRDRARALMDVAEASTAKAVAA